MTITGNGSNFPFYPNSYNEYINTDTSIGDTIPSSAMNQMGEGIVALERETIDAPALSGGAIISARSGIVSGLVPKSTYTLSLSSAELSGFNALFPNGLTISGDATLTFDIRPYDEQNIYIKKALELEASDIASIGGSNVAFNNMIPSDESYIGKMVDGEYMNLNAIHGHPFLDIYAMKTIYGITDPNVILSSGSYIEVNSNGGISSWYLKNSSSGVPRQLIVINNHSGTGDVIYFETPDISLSTRTHFSIVMYIHRINTEVVEPNWFLQNIKAESLFTYRLYSSTIPSDGTLLGEISIPSGGYAPTAGPVATPDMTITSIISLGALSGTANTVKSIGIGCSAMGLSIIPIQASIMGSTILPRKRPIYTTAWWMNGNEIDFTLVPNDKLESAMTTLSTTSIGNFVWSLIGVK